MSTLWPAVVPIDQLDFRTVTVNYQSPDKVLPPTYQWTFDDIHNKLAAQLGHKPSLERSALSAGSVTCQNSSELSPKAGAMPRSQR